MHMPPLMIFNKFRRNDWLTEIGMDGWTEGANFTQIDGGCGEE